MEEIMMHGQTAGVSRVAASSSSVVFNALRRLGRAPSESLPPGASPRPPAARPARGAPAPGRRDSIRAAAGRPWRRHGSISAAVLSPPPAVCTFNC
jgi:hypothetical protein